MLLPGFYLHLVIRRALTAIIMISYFDIALLDSQFLAWPTTVLIKVSHIWDWNSCYSPGRYCVDMKRCGIIKKKELDLLCVWFYTCLFHTNVFIWQVNKIVHLSHTEVDGNQTCPIPVSQALKSWNLSLINLCRFSKEGGMPYSLTLTRWQTCCVYQA